MNFREYLNESKSLGTFVEVKFTDETNDNLFNYAKSIGLNPMNKSKFHATIVYSNKKLNVQKGKFNYKGNASSKSLDYLGKPNDKYRAIVLKIKSNDILNLHKKFKDEYNYIHTYKDFIPHISLQYKPEEDIDLSKIKLPDFNLEIDCYKISNLHED